MFRVLGGGLWEGERGRRGEGRGGLDGVGWGVCDGGYGEAVGECVYSLSSSSSSSFSLFRGGNSLDSLW